MPDDVTALLLAWSAGSDTAFERLLPLVQGELHRIAQACMRGERAGNSLQATALVNEAYLRLIDTRRVGWHDRAHFLAMSARLMRRHTSGSRMWCSAAWRVTAPAIAASVRSWAAT